MPVIPPTDSRTDPPYVAAERPMLEAWLDWHRATLLWKCGGLDDDQLRRRAVEPSTLSLLGLVRHMTDVERHWFRRVLAGEEAPPRYWSQANPDGDFDDAETADPAADIAAYRVEAEVCREIASRYPDLNATGSRRGEPVSLRWIYVHMIEEYARHNGHADLLRERLDGSTGE